MSKRKRTQAKPRKARRRKGTPMRMTYDQAADALAVELAPNAKSVRTVDHGPDVKLDFDRRGRLIAVEILEASTHYPAAALEALEDGTEWLTLQEAAAESGLAPDTLRSQIHKGKLQAQKRGRDWYVAGHALWNYLENRDPAGRRPARKRAPAAAGR